MSGATPTAVLIRGAAPYGEDATDLMLVDGRIAALGSAAATHPAADGAGWSTRQD
jgi:hypothetical protein